jgi:hypothetical protein
MKNRNILLQHQGIICLHILILLPIMIVVVDIRMKGMNRILDCVFFFSRTKFRLFSYIIYRTNDFVGCVCHYYHYFSIIFYIYAMNVNNLLYNIYNF